MYAVARDCFSFDIARLTVMLRRGYLRPAAATNPCRGRYRDTRAMCIVIMPHPTALS
jgi:hypothetical protein